jgi:hypothetical protein
LPKINDLLQKLEGFYLATSLDLNMGYYHIELTPEASKLCTEFETTTEFLINYIKQNFKFGNDIAMAIINQKPIATTIWKLTMLFSRNIDPELKEIENKQFKIEFKADYDHYCSREQIYNNNVTKAYALFWDRCAKGMKNKIKSRSDFKLQIENNPIELLQAIKKHSLNYKEKKYNMSVILDSVKTLLTTRQKEGEPLQDFTKKFWITQEVFESHLGGPIILTKILSTTTGYNVNPTDKMQMEKNKMFEEQAFKQLLAFNYLENADQSKYVSILSSLNI